jgi:hypothetical protein
MDSINRETRKREKDYSCLVELKEKYEIFKKKYNLPDFNDINKAFDIEELDSESDFLIRKIRRYISEKLAGYMRFIEVLLNPSNAPIFFFKLIKKLDNTDKETLTRLYEELGNIELETIALDLEYNEEKEADLIKKLYNLFNDEIKKELLFTLKKLSNGDNGKNKENGVSYFG